MNHRPGPACGAYRKNRWIKSKYTGYPEHGTAGTLCSDLTNCKVISIYSRSITVRNSLLKAGIVALLAVSTAQAGQAGLSSAKPGSYKVDSYHTQVGFSISHFGFTNYSGLFSGATGSLQLDPAKLGTSKLDISIPVDTVTTTVSKLTDELKGDQWFDTAKFPKAAFVSTQVV